jgi:hypothetical protein
VQRDRLRTPRSRCGAKGVVRHTSLLASVWRTAARQKLEGGSVFVTGPIQARSTPNIEMLPMLDLDVPTTKPSSRPLRLAGSDSSLYITNPTSLDFPAPTQTWFLTFVIPRNPGISCPCYYILQHGLFHPSWLALQFILALLLYLQPTGIRPLLCGDAVSSFANLHS